jgi:hypothetical protein
MVHEAEEVLGMPDLRDAAVSPLNMYAWGVLSCSTSEPAFALPEITRSRRGKSHRPGRTSIQEPHCGEVLLVGCEHVTRTVTLLIKQY